ncbi:MAG: hypothetical protein ACYS9C_03855 [Planctomycetota bacterium]
MNHLRTTVIRRNAPVCMFVILACMLHDLYGSAPYPNSSYIVGIQFDMSTVTNVCPGNGKRADRSDNWTITWADDDHQYTSWGDGGGFGGDDRDGRVSMGVARIEGSRSSYSGYNVWGGKDSESSATFKGKCYGIISISSTLYMWRSGTSSVCYGLQELRKSTDHGRTWDATGVSWIFPKEEFNGFFVPTFLQFGKDYQGARDDHVYSYAPEHTSSVNPDDEWGVNKPGRITLIRVPENSIRTESAYRFFTGLDRSGNPCWSPDIKARKPVFEDAQNGVMRTSVIYNPGIERYILIVQQVTRYMDLNGKKGHIGIYEAPEPWGPWSTVLFTNPWDIGASPHLQNSSYPGAAKTVYWNFSPKWWWDGGKRFVMVYTGPGGDQWGTVEGSFTLSGGSPPTPITPSAETKIISPAAGKVFLPANP